jgi:hypothetical protein
MGSFFTKTVAYVPYIDSYHWDGKPVDKVKKFIQRMFPLVRIEIKEIPNSVTYKRIDLLHTFTKDTREICLVVRDNKVIDILPNRLGTPSNTIDLRKQ